MVSIAVRFVCAAFGMKNCHAPPAPNVLFANTLAMATFMVLFTR